LSEKNKSIKFKIHRFIKQILSSSVEIMKVVLLFSSILLSLNYMILSDKNKCGLYSTAIPNLQCESIINIDLLKVGVIFLIYFICLLYIFSDEKKEIKKMDEDFVPYPINIETEKKAGKKGNKIILSEAVLKESEE